MGPRADLHPAGRADPLPGARARAATRCGSPAPTMPASPPRWWSSASSRRSRRGRAAARSREVPSSACGAVGNTSPAARSRAQLRRAWRLAGLEPRALHHGRGAEPRRPQGVRRAPPPRSDLSRTKRLVNWDPRLHTAVVRPSRSSSNEVQGLALVHQISDRRRTRHVHHRRDPRAPRDHAGRYRWSR